MNPVQETAIHSPRSSMEDHDLTITNKTGEAGGIYDSQRYGQPSRSNPGNQVAQRFAQTCPLHLPAPSTCPFGGICHSCPARVQAKLTVSQPDDEYEQEADRVADQVMRMPEPCSSCSEDEKLQTKPLAEQVTPLIQRQEDESEEEEEETPVQPKLSTDSVVQRQEEPEEEEEPVQTKMLDTAQVQRQEEPEEGEEEPVQTKLAEGAQIQRQAEPEEEEEPIQTKRLGGQTPQIGTELTAQIHSLRGGGQPLPPPVRAFFEPRFGRDFGDVRVHTDASAARAASTMNARAFTLGNDVVFGPGQYTSQATESNRLLAHELTHVIQQSPGLARYTASQWKKEQVQTQRRESVQMQRQAEPEKDEDEETIQPKPMGEAIIQRTPDLEAMRHYEGCEGDQNFFVELAQTRAPQWVASTIDSLEESLRPHDIVTVIDGTLNRFFPPPAGRAGTIGGRHRPETIRRIIGNLDRMLPVLRNPRPFRCVTNETCGGENSEQPDAPAYTRGARISICPSFFDLSRTEQITRLIHESAHRIGLRRDVESRESAMGLSLDAALRNAPSYALLVTENVNGPPRIATPAHREEAAPACPYPGCTEAECPTVNHTLEDAWDLVTRVLNDLEPATRGQPLSDRTRNAFAWHFRTLEPDDIQSVYDRFTEIRGWLLPITDEFRCTSTGRCSRPNVLAFAGPRTPITLCQQRFFHQGRTERAMVMIHEGAHRTGLALDSDPDVYDHEAPRFRALTREEALHTPDSYANFARDNRFGVPVAIERDLRMNIGAVLQSGQPQLYMTVGGTFEGSHPVLRIFNPVAGIYLTYMTGIGEASHRIVVSADAGLRLARARPATGLYLDVRGGVFAGFPLSEGPEEESLLGVSGRLGAGYRSDRLDLGLDVEYWHNFLSEHPDMTLVGVRAQLRF